MRRAQLFPWRAPRRPSEDHCSSIASGGMVDIVAGPASDWQSGGFCQPSAAPARRQTTCFLLRQRAPLAAFGTIEKYPWEAPRTCQTADLDSARRVHGRSAPCWLPPRAQTRALRTPRGARAPSKKSILRAPGGEGKGVWAWGSRGGTEELPICQPARRGGRNTHSPSGALCVERTLAGWRAGSARGSLAACPQPAKPQDLPAAFCPKPAPSQPAPAPALLAPVKVQDHDDHDGAARRARNRSGGR